MEQQQKDQFKEEFEIIAKIAERADALNLLAFDRFSLIMDIQHVNDSLGLRLQDLLDADNFNFAHDIAGIQNNFNRETKQLENCFLPRYTKPQQ